MVARKVEKDKKESLKSSSKADVPAKQKKSKAAQEPIVSVPLDPELQLSEESSDEPMIRFFSWNVNGIRALLKKDTAISFLRSMVAHPECAALGLQEIKCCEDNFPDILSGLENLENHRITIHPSIEKKGYSGVWGIANGAEIRAGLGQPKFDMEGRILTMEFPKFYFVTAYVPNASQGLKRLDERCDEWEVQILDYLKGLEAKKPVIYCGDLNVACSEIELANPKSNYNKSAGYTQREIDCFNNLISGVDLVDSFRHLYPDETGKYTYWGYRFNARQKNIGWRMDYFLISKKLLPALKDVIHHDKVMGSDHCPIELQLDKKVIDNLQI